MKIIKTPLIRAARAALGWSSHVLAEKSGISVNAISKLESGQTQSANARTYKALADAFNNAGVFFNDTGLDLRQSYVRELDGPDFFIEVLDDIYNTLIDSKDAEVLTIGADDRENTPVVTQRLRKIKNAGIRMRDMIEHGNTYMINHVGDYRWIPSKYFNKSLKIIYGDKVYIDFHTHAILLSSAFVAKFERETFNMIWDMLPELTVESTADERI